MQDWTHSSSYLICFLNMAVRWMSYQPVDQIRFTTADCTELAPENHLSWQFLYLIVSPWDFPKTMILMVKLWDLSGLTAVAQHKATRT